MGRAQHHGTTCLLWDTNGIVAVEHSDGAYACVLQVTVHYPHGRQQLVTYRQAFTGE